MLNNFSLIFRNGKLFRSLKCLAAHGRTCAQTTYMYIQFLVRERFITKRQLLDFKGNYRLCGLRVINYVN